MNKLFLASIVAAFVVLALPVGAQAQGAWATLSTGQHQGYTGSAAPLTMTQVAKGTAAVSFGNQAEAISQQFAKQTQHSGAATMAHQGQKTSSGADLSISRHGFTTVGTSGGAWQHQNIWGYGAQQEQFASTWQGSRVGNTTSVVDGFVHQRNVGSGAGDFSQNQDIVGSTKAQGFTWPKSWFKWSW